MHVDKRTNLIIVIHYHKTGANEEEIHIHIFTHLNKSFCQVFLHSGPPTYVLADLAPAVRFNDDFSPRNEGVTDDCTTDCRNLT